MARLRLTARDANERAVLKVDSEVIGSAYSPTIEVEDSEDGHLVRTTHMTVDGLVTQEFDVHDGVDVSIAVEDVFDGHIVTLTGIEGSRSYHVPNYISEETARADAERGRVAAETARDAAEGQREAAERARADAEGIRVLESQSAVQSAHNAAGNANGVADALRAARDAGEFDGISPVAVTSRIEGGVRISVTDRDGTTTADVLDAGFGTPTATVDQTIGTPSVTVTADGTNTAKAFHFAFAGLKGEKGDTGDATQEGSVTSKELANGAVTKDKIAEGVFSALSNEQIDAWFAEEELDG